MLLVLCGVSLLLTLLAAADDFGLGRRPWYGWWDANVKHVASYVVAVAQPVPGGATDRAGLRTGDLIDLREQSEASRVPVLFQLMGDRPTMLVVHRGATTRTFAVTGTSVWEGQPLFKLATILSFTLANVWFVACAFLIALRRSDRRDGLLLAVVLLFITGFQMTPSFVVVPSAVLQLWLFVAATACMSAALITLVVLSSQFGARSVWRSTLEWVAVAAALLPLAIDAVVAVGAHTLWFDPTPYVLRLSAIRGFVAIAAGFLMTLAAWAAAAATPPSDRPRAAWMLLPIPVAFLAQAILVAVSSFLLRSWFAVVGAAALGDVAWLLASWTVTYALLKRRVLDLEFVITRTLVVGTVSAIVVASFALLEWLLGAVLTGASHATGLIANGALALVLGLSLNPIHQRVDALVESMLFRKRHDNERALLDFSKEAAYVTSFEALLDAAIEKLSNHTDARGASILLDGEGDYRAVRRFGDDTARTVGENDPAVLALKTWHKPIDPHQYASEIHGALALPMLARGRLLGLTVLGERAGGEAYAPDEIEALAQFAHGVGAALDLHTVRRDDSFASLRDTLTAMSAAIAELGNETAELKRSIVR